MQNLEGSISFIDNPRLPIYANLVKNGIITIAQVPVELRGAVEALLASDVPFDLNYEGGSAGVSPIVTYASIHEFPNVGIINRLYLAEDTNSIYRWDGINLIYRCVGTSTIEEINGGNSHG